MSDISNLVKQRGILKAKLTRFKTYFDSISKPEDVTQLNIRLQKLELCFLEFEKVQTEIELISDSEEQLNEREAFESIYFDLTAAAHDFIAALSQTQNVIETKPKILLQKQPISVKLPDINLPVFSGCYDEWVSFHDTFVSLIHSKEIPDVQKFHYLKCSLKGDASDVLCALESSGENYKIAWKLLNDRFGNKRYLINKHVSALFNLSKNDRENSLSLRKLLDNALKHIRALSGLGQPTESWDTIMIHVITSKLDSITLREWENSLKSDQLPKMSELETFLHHKCQVLEAVESGKSQKPPFNSNSSNKFQVQKFKSFVNNSSVSTSCHSSTRNCSLCKEPQHPIYFCKTFKLMSIPDREKEVKRRGLCYNCLKGFHKTVDCPSSLCKHCGKKHNTLLHVIPTRHSVQSETNLPAANSITQPTVVSHANSNNVKLTVLLSTAVVSVLDCNGAPHLCRILLDSGSQSHFISDRLVRRLGIATKKDSIRISGIGNSSTQTAQTAQCVVRSRIRDFSVVLDCVVLKNITQNVPTFSLHKDNVKIPPNLQLADPSFFKSAEIDLLVGAEYFFNLLCDGKINPEDTGVIFQNTVFGWVIAGRVDTRSTSTTSLCNLSIEEKIDHQLQQFWKLEEVSHSSSNQLSKTELECENHFVETVARDEEGRFVVRLPVKSVGELGTSKETALRRLEAQERRFSKDPVLKERYCAFMREYAEMGHMECVKEEVNEQNQLVYYLPHHAVTNEASSTTKLRVVFDGSCKTSTGVSLNSMLLVGPKVQEDLFNILLRFRKHQIVFTADIEKMYRQIKIHEKDRNLQRILWRETPNQPVQTFKLTTVTYGTASAPFLATRCLQELAVQEQEKYPNASEVTQADFYVDDVLSGADDVAKAKSIQSELISMLKCGGFQLRKWCSNDVRLLEWLPDTDKHQQYVVQQAEESEPIKMLGVMWESRDDTFTFSVKCKPYIHLTRRTVLSQIASLFDPLGLIAPVISKAKIFMQQLWLLKIAWDDPLPDSFQQLWKKFVSELPALQSMRVPRKLFPVISTDPELHGFCDASELAYGACVYVRGVSSNQGVSIRLVAAKSRVAPIKKVSLPRLELCAALLLAQLTSQTIKALKIENLRTVLWSDSTVTLSWINSSSHQWKTFVANRVARIQELTGPCEWRHVRSEDNPADYVSRGLMPNQIHDLEVWWSGPLWLMDNRENWPNTSFTETDIEKRKPPVVSMITGVSDFWVKFSSFIKLQRTVAYCLRFFENCKRKKEERVLGLLSTTELTKALNCLIKIAQHEKFEKEFQTLSKGLQVHSKSVLRTLHPFCDKDNIIRVGGRLSLSELDFNQQHPIVLPAKHQLTTLIMKHEHIRQLHAGPQLLLASTRRRFWPLNGRNTARKIVHECITCFRVKPKSNNQLMGDLPKERSQPTRPFLNTGVDYCGPVMVRVSRRRGITPDKAYIAVFVCMVTKAVHLELVGDLTTQSFLGALKRFMSRRGKVLQLFSDNATNFVGANKELEIVRNLLNSSDHREQVERWLAQDNITWKFIPPRAPHFGGLWEASVKSLKYHLRRIVGNATLTYEEMYTTLTMIEACLNSRPISPLSNDPNDLLPLTPGHFLIGDVITSPVEPDFQSTPMNRLTRWQVVQRNVQHFWSRWSNEYLTGLQQRVKWQAPGKNLAVGDLVIIKEDNIPPLKWNMGRVLQLHPGKDGSIRVVTIKTATGVFKRATNRLCLLPMEE